MTSPAVLRKETVSVSMCYRTSGLGCLALIASSASNCDPEGVAGLGVDLRRAAEDASVLPKNMNSRPQRSPAVVVNRCHRTARLAHAFRFLMACAAVVLTACSDGEKNPVPTTPQLQDAWQVAVEAPAAAFFSVHGTSNEDVWVVGADDGSGPLVVRFDGTDWQRLDTGVHGDLWWVRAFDDGTVYLAGTDSIILRYRDGTFERMKTPGLGKTTIFGLWGSTSNDVYAVGSHAGRNGFVWHFDGVEWRDLPLPDDHLLSADNDLSLIHI